MRRTVAAACLCLAACSQPPPEAPVAERPNIIVALADDLGYGDLGCYGNSEVRTPHLDRFASEGLRLTSCYSGAPNCSPARTALMTGRTPTRVGVHNWIPMFSPMHVPASEITIATILRNEGYSTAHAGKWHLNGRFNLDGQPQPPDHGFDHWFSTQNNALPTHKNPDNFVRNGEPVGRLEGFSGELVAEEAINWLSSGRDPEKPFFLFVCFHEPHEPIHSAPRFTEMYADEGPRSRYDPAVSSLAAHHGNVSQLDDSFGRLMSALDEQGLRESTLVLFTSDNGPAITTAHPHGSAGPLRLKKGHLYEGGIRVPGIVRWPGRTTPGQVSDTPVSGVDVLPTLAAVAGAPLPHDRVIDGASFVPLLEGEPIRRYTPLYWHFNRASSAPKVAMRVGDWKILAKLTGMNLGPGPDLVADEMESVKTAELTGFELYNLREDIGETTDLSQAEPERLLEMTEQLQDIYEGVLAESPEWPVWESPRYEGQRIREYVDSLE